MRDRCHVVFDYYELLKKTYFKQITCSKVVMVSHVSVHASI